jgi:hypothetical protein
MFDERADDSGECDRCGRETPALWSMQGDKVCRACYSAACREHERRMLAAFRGEREGREARCN